MKRKVNRVGTGTLTVSLPSAWTKKHNVKYGDEIDVEERQNGLLVSTKPKASYQKTTITLESGNDWYVSQLLRNLYLAGMDEIKVNYPNRNVIPQIHKIMDLLLGYEIIETRDTHCIIKNLSAGLDTELDTLLRKIFLLTKTIIGDAIEHLKKGKIEVELIRSMRDTIHKFSSFYRRTITKQHLYCLVKNRAIFIILTRVMMISNNVLYAHRYLASKNKLPDLKPAVKYLQSVLELFNLFYDTFYSQKFSQLAQINSVREELIDRKFVQMAETNHGEVVVACHYYAEIVRLIATNGGAMIKFHQCEEK